MNNNRDTVRFWLTVLISAVGVAVVSLSAHVLMLQVLGVPFPDRTAVSAWASLLNSALAVLALSMFYRVAKPQLAGLPAWCRWLLIAALFGALKELLRGGIMNGVVTTAWVFSAAQLLSPMLYCLALSAAIVFVVDRRYTGWQRFLTGLAAAAILVFAVKPLIALALSPLMQSVSGVSHDDVYSVPYGAYVLAWAYLTYLEPTVACIICAALVLPGLSVRPLVRVAQFTLLILLIKGALLPTLVFGFYNRQGVEIGSLSESQFLLEAILLAMPVAVIWPRAARMTRRV